jgi:hypothetical protein
VLYNIERDNKVERVHWEGRRARDSCPISRDNLASSDHSPAFRTNLEAAPARAVELTEETAVTTPKIEK